RHLHTFPTRRSSDLSPKIPATIDRNYDATEFSRLRRSRIVAASFTATRPRGGGDMRAHGSTVRLLCSLVLALMAPGKALAATTRSEEHTSELQSPDH